jgi:hypothetical protein
MLVRSLLVVALAAANAPPASGDAGGARPDVTYRLGLLVRGPARTPVRTPRKMAEDPAVRAGRLKPRVLKWWTAFGNIPGH